MPNITLTPPLDYLPMVHLMQRAHLVLTDSGGIQEEATSLGKPTLVLREVTERPEGVEAGVLKLVGTDRQRILAEARRLLDDEAAYQAMAQRRQPLRRRSRRRADRAGPAGQPMNPALDFPGHERFQSASSPGSKASADRRPSARA